MVDESGACFCSRSGDGAAPRHPFPAPCPADSPVRLGQSRDLAKGGRLRVGLAGSGGGSRLRKQSLALVHGLLPGMEALQPPLAQLRDAKIRALSLLAAPTGGLTVS